MKLTDKSKQTGQVTTERTIKEQGRNKRDIPAVGDYEAGTTTTAVGPFSVSEVHAVVGGDVKVTLSQDYHAVSVGISVRIPVDPNHEAVKQGLDYCFDTAHGYLEEELKGARKALDRLTR